MKAAIFAMAVLATASVVFHFSTTVNAAKASEPGKAAGHEALSLPLFFEPNQGQTAPPVKFLARGAGFGLFLTADEAVLELQRSAPSPFGSGQAKNTRRPAASSSVIRMRLDGANASARVSGASPLPGKSSYFIGNDPSQWHRDIPQFGRVEYKGVYPGVDLVYYGDQGKLEYDFRVAPGAEANQIALSFAGASVHIDSGDSGNSGDLILSTANGDVRFHAPHIYQADGNKRKPVAGSFRQIAENRIGFTVGDYDHSRELVIDPVLSYSTYLGGGGESLVKIALDGTQAIYVAGSTNSTAFPVTNGSTLNPAPNAQNIFISKIDQSQTGAAQLVYSIYLGGSGTDSLAGIAVDQNFNIYVAGTTTSSDFPTTPNAFQPAPAVAGAHGFISAITNVNSVYGITYSTYLAGNGADTVTGLAIDSSCSTQLLQGISQAVCDVYVTGNTTSDNVASSSAPFPASPNGYQTKSNSPGNPQFFASKLNTGSSGPGGMMYSTYFGGANFAQGADLTANEGGGIAVDPSGSSIDMYITGTTNMLPGTDTVPGFPLFNAQQPCLGQIATVVCSSSNPTATDAFVAKINPNPSGNGANPVYSTYLGGSGKDVGAGIAVDSSGNAYIVGSTESPDFIPTTLLGLAFQPCLNSPTSVGSCPNNPDTTHHDAFIAKISNQTSTNSIFPLSYATYLGGSGEDIGQAIQVDLAQAVHVVGSTESPDLPTDNVIQPNLPISSYNGSLYGGGEDAFVALISTTLAGRGVGDYVTYLGGGQLDEGTGIAIDTTFNATYVAGDTRSTAPPFPTTSTAYQPTLIGSQDAFVSKLGANSPILVSVPTDSVTHLPTSPAPNPVSAGANLAFTFDVTNSGLDPASLVTFYAFNLPASPEVQIAPTAKVTGGGSGSCTLQTTTETITCPIGTLAANAVATVEVDMTPASPIVNSQITISGAASANGDPVGRTTPQPFANVVDFSIAATTPADINAGDPPSLIQVTFCPTNGTNYNGTITPSQTTNPSMVTATTPTFNPTTVQLQGNACGTTVLSIATVARPVVTGGLFRRGSVSFYAALLPIGGLSLVGFGIGASRKRRRWLIGAVLGLIAGAILLQAGCGSSSSSVTPGSGTQAATYIITITGSAASAASHAKEVFLTVH